MPTVRWLFLALASAIGWIVGLFAVPVQLIYRISSRRYDLDYYLKQIAVGNDVMAGSMIYGSKHTISAITGYKSYRGSKWHRKQERLIDGIGFGHGHCRRAAIKENLIKEAP